MLELERIHSHLLWLGVAGHEAGFDTFFMYVWRDREIVMDILEMVSGQRMMHGFLRIGGMQWDLPDGFEARVRALMTGAMPKVFAAVLGITLVAMISRTVRIGSP